MSSRKQVRDSLACLCVVLQLIGADHDVLGGPKIAVEARWRSHDAGVGRCKSAALGACKKSQVTDHNSLMPACSKQLPLLHVLEDMPQLILTLRGEMLQWHHVDCRDE